MNDNKLSPYQIGGGAGATALVMFMLQSQGVGIIDKNQDAINEVAVEKALNNEKRIDRLEINLKDLNNKLDSGFAGIRSQMNDQRDYMASLLKNSTGDRWTKQDHVNYADIVRQRFELIEERLRAYRGGRGDTRAPAN